MTLLSVADLHGGYGEQDILNGVSVELREGEVVTAIGPNGAGKSTLLKAIVGLAVRRSGSVTWNGRDVSHLGPEDLADDGLILVPQTANVFPSLTVDENLQVVATKRRLAGSEVQAIWDSFPGLARLRAARARTLSGGERQLLAFAKAIVSRPRALLLDEPTAALAPAMAQTILERVSSIAAGGTSIFMVEQNARAALAVSDRGYVIVDGRAVYEGSGPNFLDDPVVTDLFIPGHSSQSVTN